MLEAEIQCLDISYPDDYEEDVKSSEYNSPVAHQTTSEESS